MTTEEKALELSSKYVEMIFAPKKYTVSDCLIEMANWKEKQTIEKACEWLKDNIHDYYMTNEFEQWFDDMFDDLKEAMKGGEE